MKFECVMLPPQLRKTLDLDTEEAGSLLECQKHLYHENGKRQQFQLQNPCIFLWQNARNYIHFVVLYTVNFGLLIALIRAFAFNQSCSDPSQGLYCKLQTSNASRISLTVCIITAPAQEAVEYRSKLYFYNGHESYENFPYEKQDELWLSSYNCMSF